MHEQNEQMASPEVVSKPARRSLKSFFGAQDMTENSPISCLVKFSMPLLIGNVAQQLYNTVDSIVVGQYVGDAALAAVGASGPILNLLLVLFIGIATGGSIMVSQYFGAKQKEALSHTVGMVITLNLICSLMIMIVGPLITRPLMSLMNTPPDVYEMACTYLVIVFVGIAGLAYYNILSGVLRGLGDSVSPLIFLLVACGLNIVLDILFVAVFRWNVAGVAWATVISQTISGILCFLRLLSMREVVTINLQMLKLKKDMVKQILKLGLPSGLSQAIFSLASLVVQSLTNSFGTLVIACATVLMRVDGFAMMPNFTFGTAMTTFSGQNIGAGKLERVHKGVRSGLILAVSVAVVLTSSILIFGRPLMGMFTKTQEVVDLGMQMMGILALGYVCMGITQVFCGTMQGAGDTITPMLISFTTTVVIRVPLAYGLAWMTRSPERPTGSPISLYISLLVSWVLGAVLAFFFYKRGKWRRKAITVSASQD